MTVESATSVVIVGAGPTGLLLACELGSRGIPVIVIDSKVDLSRHPRANTQSARSMEIYRRHGISATIRRSGLPRARATDVAYFSRLFGYELYRVPLPSPLEADLAARLGDPRWPTPEPQTRASQMLIEPVLLERARSFDCVDVRFDCKAIDLSQDAARVDLVVQQRDSGEPRVIRSQFLVGCDGGRSFVRKALGIRFHGESSLEMDFLGGRMLATYFRAPTLLDRFPHADAWMHWIMQPTGRGILVLIDYEKREFLLHFQLKAEENEHTVDFPTRLEAALGEAIPHEVLSSAEWRAGIGLVAERFSVGRSFLVGDAIHLFTPTGGFGLNTGIEDAFNLAWKLAAVCRGVAPPALLATYETERRPVALRNTAYALQLAQKNGACPVSTSLDDPGSAGEAARAASRAHLQQFARWEFDTPGVQLGSRYDGSPLIASHDSPPPADSPTTYVPTTLPGGRVPHVWLRDGVSLYDQLGPEFTLLCPAGRSDSEEWLRAAASLRVQLSLLNLEAEPEARKVLGAEDILVRPDQHIAWRGLKQNSPLAVLNMAIGKGSNGQDAHL